MSIIEAIESRSSEIEKAIQERDQMNEQFKLAEQFLIKTACTNFRLTCNPHKEIDLIWKRSVVIPGLCLWVYYPDESGSYEERRLVECPLEIRKKVFSFLPTFIKQIPII